MTKTVSEQTGRIIQHKGDIPAGYSKDIETFKNVGTTIGESTIERESTIEGKILLYESMNEKKAL